MAFDISWRGEDSWLIDLYATPRLGLVQWEYLDSVLTYGEWSEEENDVTVTHGEIDFTEVTDATNDYSSACFLAVAWGRDTDGDWLLDGDELYVYATDPENADTDYDGICDGDEIDYGFDPKNPHTLSEVYCDGVAMKLGGVDPFSYPDDSTNTVWEHVFYTGSTNMPFAYPLSSDEVGVLRVTASGSGSGELIVGDKVVPLLAPQTCTNGVYLLANDIAPIANDGGLVENTLLVAVGKGERNGKALVFLHGANVAEADAEVWGDVIFKRMWLSGSRADFYNVDWRSNIGSAANYHENASNAFVVASQIASTINAIPCEKVVMAHSLGNMVVSSMIQDYGLQVSKYLMCNSAVPAEAYDTSLAYTNALIHSDWSEYPARARANEWYHLFDENSGDDRCELTWEGRFSDVNSVAVNFYSSGDHVLELYPRNDIGFADGYENWSQKYERYSWHKQELWKGRKGVLARMGTTDWAGWSIRENVLGYNTIQPTNAWLMADEELKTNTVFKLYPEWINTNVISLLDRGLILANGISSRTCAAGFASLGGELMMGRNYNFNSTDPDTGCPRPNGWPVRVFGFLFKSTWEIEWLHSDIKDISYYFNFKAFKKLKEQGGL